MKSHLQPWLLQGVEHNILGLFAFVAAEGWPGRPVIIGAIWIAWTRSLGYWPYRGSAPDVFLYTAVKQEVEPKPKIDSNHCFVKSQNWSWIIIFLWLHWIQIIAGHSWIQPKLRANRNAQTLTRRLKRWDFEGQESVSCNECSECYLYANTNSILSCMCAYIFICVYSSSSVVYTTSF